MVLKIGITKANSCARTTLPPRRLHPCALLVPALLAVGTKVQAAEIIGKPSGETIDGTTGFDRIYGRGGYDNLSGNLGNDIIYPDGSTGLFAGGGGDDIILFRSACELSFNNIVSIDGGAGYDTLVIPIPLDQFRRLAPLVSITNIETRL